MRKLCGILLIVTIQAHAQTKTVAKHPPSLVHKMTVVLAHDTVVSHKRIIDTVWNHYLDGDFIDYAEKKTLIDTSTCPYFKNLLIVY